MMTRLRGRSDGGFAMAAVLGIAAVVTVVAIGAYFLASETLHDSVRNRGETRAFQVANSGLELELATFNSDNLDDYPKNGTTEDGSYAVTVQQLDAYEYIIQCRGVSEGANETVTQRFFYLNLWDLNMGAGEGASLGGGSAWNGQATIDGPLYIRGDMEWGSSSNYYGGPLFIRDGKLITTHGGAGCDLGTAADPVRVYCTGGTVDLHKIDAHIDGPVRTSVPDIELPWVTSDYMDAAEELARKESTDNKMGGIASSAPNTETVIIHLVPQSYADGTTIPGRLMADTAPAGTSDYYKYRGDAGGHGPLNNGTHTLDIGGASFGAWPGNGYPAASATFDDFAYDAGTGTLYVNGTVLIDGPVNILAGVNNYVGNGTLVCNGDVYIEGNLVPRDGLSASEALGIVTAGDVWLHREQMTGAVFCNGTFTLDKPGTVYEGTVLAGVISATSPNITLRTNPILKDVLPESMPGAGGGLIFPGTWSRQ